MARRYIGSIEIVSFLMKQSLYLSHFLESTEMRKRIFIEIPGNCISRCSGCFSNATNEFDLAIFEKILCDAVELGFNWIGLCGRDPFQSAYKDELINIVLNSRRYVRIYSSLLGSDCLPEYFKNNFNRLDITFIIWGMPEIHDIECGIKGAFFVIAQPTP